MYITLSEAKKHLNIEDWFTEDDKYILQLISVSEDVVEKRIGKPLHKCIDKDGYLEPSIKHSILLLLGTYYMNRESTAPNNVKPIPYTFEYLADLNKQYFIY